MLVKFLIYMRGGATVGMVHWKECVQSGLFIFVCLPSNNCCKFILYSLIIHLLNNACRTLGTKTKRWMPTCQAGTMFSQNYRGVDLHTNGPVSQLIYHLGPDALVSLTPGFCKLTEDASKIWHTFTHSVQNAVEKLPTLKIPGGKMKKSISN